MVGIRLFPFGARPILLHRGRRICDVVRPGWWRSWWGEARWELIKFCCFFWKPWKPFFSMISNDFWVRDGGKWVGNGWEMGWQIGAAPKIFLRPWCSCRSWRNVVRHCLRSRWNEGRWSPMLRVQHFPTRPAASAGYKKRMYINNIQEYCWRCGFWWSLTKCESYVNVTMYLYKLFEVAWHESKTAIQLYFSAGLSAPGRKSTLFASFASADRVLLFGLLMGCRVCQIFFWCAHLCLCCTDDFRPNAYVCMAASISSIWNQFRQFKSPHCLWNLILLSERKLRNQLDHHLSWPAAGQESEARLDNLACVFEVRTLCTRYSVYIYYILYGYIQKLLVTLIVFAYFKQSFYFIFSNTFNTISSLVCLTYQVFPREDPRATGERLVGTSMDSFLSQDSGYSLLQPQQATSKIGFGWLVAGLETFPSFFLSQNWLQKTCKKTVNK